MNGPANLTAGSKVSTRHAGGRGRVAAIVFDEEGRAFGLSALHVLRRERDDVILDHSGRVELGRNVDMQRTEPPASRDYDGEPFLAAIGAFEIPGYAVDAAAAALPQGNPRATASPFDCVGSRLFKVDGSADRAAATVLSVGGGLLLDDPDSGSSRPYYDVIELGFEPGGRDPVAAGEGGSLLVDAQGCGVGILIAGTRERCYAAPLQAYLEQHHLSLMPPITEARAAAATAAAGADVLPNAAEAIAGARAMRAELESEPALQGDPRGNDVPVPLLKLLEEA